MANVSHVTLTGTEVHEPKGVDNANLGEVYVADGNGSGNWSAVGTSSFTGMIADFVWPVVQTGWLELDGSDINTTTFGALYDVMTIQQTGTRINGNPTITSLGSTANMRVGYYVFGTGIASGTTILSVDSATQITMSGNASSGGTAQVVVSPWLLNTGTIRLPDVSAAGRYRRSRTSSTAVGQLQDSQNLAHTHAVAGNTGNQNVSHTHNVSGGTGGMSRSNPHTHASTGANLGLITGSTFGSFTAGGTNLTNIVNGNTDIDHEHSFNVISNFENSSHIHAINFASGSTGSSEARPTSIVLMTCVKT